MYDPKWVRLAAAALAALFAVLFVVMVSTQPHIEYETEGFQTRCNAVFEGDGRGWLFDESGGPLDAWVVDGQDAFEEERASATDAGRDLFFIQRSLDKDCVDRRQTRMMWATVWAALGVAAFAVAVRPSPRPRREVAPD